MKEFRIAKTAEDTIFENHKSKKTPQNNDRKRKLRKYKNTAKTTEQHEPKQT